MRNRVDNCLDGARPLSPKGKLYILELAFTDSLSDQLIRAEE